MDGRLHVVTSTGRILWPNCKAKRQNRGKKFFGEKKFATVDIKYDRQVEEELWDDGLDEDEAFEDGVEEEEFEFDDGYEPE